MKCGECGASYTKCGLNRFACAGARDRATCSNHLTIHGEDIEVAILAGLKERLMEAALFGELVKEFTAEVNRQRSALADEKVSLKSELDRVTRQIDRLVEAILGGADALAVNTKLKELEAAEQAALTDKLGGTPDAEPLLHSGPGDDLPRKVVESLETRARRTPSTGQEAFEAAAALIE